MSAGIVGPACFFLLELGIVCGRSQQGGTGVVMEDRKAAPALRARSLRSYVPLRLRPERKCVLRHHASPSLLPHTNPNCELLQNC